MNESIKNKMNDQIQKHENKIKHCNRAIQKIIDRLIGVGISRETHIFNSIFNSIFNTIYGDHTDLHIGYKSKKERCPNCGSRIWENRIGTQWCGNFIDGRVNNLMAMTDPNFEYCNWINNF